jgi:hypothetical protein
LFDRNNVSDVLVGGTDVGEEGKEKKSRRKEQRNTNPVRGREIERQWNKKCWAVKVRRKYTLFRPINIDRRQGREGRYNLKG